MKPVAPRRAFPGLAKALAEAPKAEAKKPAPKKKVAPKKKDK